MNARRASAVVVFVLASAWLIPPAESGSAPMVDFRLAPLEQAKSVHTSMNGLDRKSATHTIVVLRDGSRTDDGERAHLVVPAERATPAFLAEQLSSGNSDSVSWRSGMVRLGACDSTSECVGRTNGMCEAAGHNGVDRNTVAITSNLDGTRTCSGTCKGEVAMAFVTCGNPTCHLCS